MNKTNLLLSHHEVARILDVNKDRLRGWLNEGFIKPSVPSTGRGKANLYSQNDLYALGLFMMLIDTGYSREFSGDATNIFLRKVADTDPHTITKFAIVRATNNQEYVQVDEFTRLVPFDFTFNPDKELSIILADDVEWTRYEVINLEGIMRRIDAAIESSK